MVEARVYNRELELQGVVDNFSSFTWIRRYFEPGEFEIHVPATEQNQTLFIPGYIVARHDGMNEMEAGTIESLERSGYEIIARGRFLESYLDRRLIIGTYNFSGKTERGMRNIVSRMTAIPLLELGELQDFDETVEFQATYKGVLSYLEKLCVTSGIAFRLRPDFTTRALIFECYKGIDRTVAGAAQVIFSETYNNLTEESYTYNDTAYKTKCFVGGAGEGSSRIIVQVGGGSGLDLREVFRNASQSTQEGMTDAEYRAVLAQEGEAVLADSPISESFSFKVAGDQYTYRTDYDIGDIIKVRRKSWGIESTLRITEVEEVYESGGREIMLTVGNTVPETVDWNAD